MDSKKEKNCVYYVNMLEFSFYWLNRNMFENTEHLRNTLGVLGVQERHTYFRALLTDTKEMEIVFDTGVYTIGPGQCWEVAHLK